MERLSPIRLDSLEDYEASIEAELQAAKALQTQQTLKSQQTQESAKAEPDAHHRHAEPVEAVEEAPHDDATQPLDVVDIRGRIQTIRDLTARPPAHKHFDVRI